MNHFDKHKATAIEAMEQAQHIAFGPFIFQATRVLTKSGILAAIEKTKDGLEESEIQSAVNLSKYAIRVLLQAGLGIGLLIFKNGKYNITDVAYFILNDKLTKVNMDFVHDVCYNGMYFLEESFRNGRPEGLKVFGPWPTLYEGLANFPEQVRKSWLAFDHYYSDFSFPELLPIIFRDKPKSILDIGGNTGRWALQCFEHDKDVAVTILDLPGQVNLARQKIDEHGFSNRIRFHEADVLKEETIFPKGFDIVWMSQFLDCFSEEQITSILKRCHQAINPEGCVYILELFWDRQRFRASAFALQQTSLYFTAMANGNSQMYNSEVFYKCIEEAGFEIVEQKDQIGVSHSLLKCRPKTV